MSKKFARVEVTELDCAVFSGPKLNKLVASFGFDRMPKQLAIDRAALVARALDEAFEAGRASIMLER